MDITRITLASFSLLLILLSNPVSASTPAISSGMDHSCELSDTGFVKCWGSNSRGQLGDGTNYRSYFPVAVIGLGIVTAISSGSDHTCALTDTGMVKCWGNNDFGALGNGNYSDSNVPVAVSGLSNITAISSGDNHTCALNEDGMVTCWGNGGSGQRGDGTYKVSNVPVAVSGLSNVTAISSGGVHTCALTNTGTLMCWGWNYFGQLGDGTNNDSNVPVAVSGLSNVAAISSGFHHTCALINTGTAMCWGYNGSGALGDGTNINKNVPVVVSGLSNITAISSGGSPYGGSPSADHTCALTSTGTVKCWGSNKYGQLGDGGSSYSSNVPVSVLSGLSNVTAISSGGLHTCALTNTGSATCWGWNSFGQLGDGTDNPSSVPFPRQLSLLSVASKDGWILESKETSSKGGYANASSKLLRVGDSSTDRQYRSILDFDTSALPDNAVILKARLMLENYSMIGSVSNLGDLVVDMRTAYFGANSSLSRADFQAAPSQYRAATLAKSNHIYYVVLNKTAMGLISKTADTQFRLRFAKGDNDDKGNDYLSFYSGNASSSKPSLVIEYYVP